MYALASAQIEKKHTRRDCAIYDWGLIFLVDRISDMTEWRPPLLLCSRSHDYVLNRTR